MASERRGAMPDWLVIAQELWDEVERRNQLIVRRLAERHPRSRTLFAETPLRPRHIRRWRLPRPRQAAPQIWAVRPIRPFPHTLGSWSDRLEALQLRWAMRRLGIDAPAVWTQDPRAAGLLPRLARGLFVYDLTDDWAAFETEPAARQAIESRIDWLSSEADVIFACSRPLAEKFARWGDKLHYLPNAVDLPRADLSVPADLSAVSRPRLGYVGTLHDARLDAELVKTLGRTRPDWSIVFIGPNELTDEAHELLRLPNVHYLGVKRHDEVAAYLAGLDAGLIPHHVNEFTRSLDPLKLYQYLAAGLPVISTALDYEPSLRDLVSVTTTASEFVDATERALEATEADREARRARVEAETWSARASDIERTIGAEMADTSSAADVCVVIVSFNTRDVLADALHHLEAQEGATYHAVVVDNGSDDGSVEMLRERFPDVHVVELGTNVGFGAANNVGFDHCRSEFVLLLNSDAFLRPGALASLVATARANPDAGAIGPRLLNADGSLQRSAWPFPTATRYVIEAIGLHRLLGRAGLLDDLGTWEHDEERDVDFLIGACLLVRRAALNETQGFDESFWLYAEEADLQYRMRKLRWRVLFAPTAEAVHLGGASSTNSVLRLQHFYRGQRQFFRKHAGEVSWQLARAAVVFGAILRGRWKTAKAVALLSD